MTAQRRTTTERIVEVASDELLDVVRMTVTGGAGVWVRIRGGSMAPTIPANSEVLVGAVLDGTLAVGDVVLALLSSGPVLHRVVALDPEKVWLRGDNRRVDDPPIARSSVIARVVAMRAPRIRSNPNARRLLPWGLFRRVFRLGLQLRHGRY